MNTVEFRPRLLLLATFAVLGLHAQSTLAAGVQSVQQVIISGHTTIHTTPVGSGVLATPELASEIDVGVKPQTVGHSAVRAPLASTTYVRRQHGLAIPGKRAAANHFRAVAQSSVTAAAATLPLAEPTVRGSRVIDFPGEEVSGFAGISHRDQRIANHGNQFSLEPPDQAICAGNGFVVEAVNNAIRVFDKSGNSLTAVEALNSFFGLADEIDRTKTPAVIGPFISDPRCAYDVETQRWFVTELMQDNGGNLGATNRNFNMIAVSQTSDPRGAFTVFMYDVTDDGLQGTSNHPGCPCFGDQPLLGLDHYGLYQSTNEFGAGFNGAQLYAISKKDLVNAANGLVSTPLQVVHIDASQQLAPFGGLSYTIQPAVSPPDAEAIAVEGAPAHGVELFLSALQFGNPGYEVYDNRIAVWALTNTRSLDGASPALSLTFEVVSSETYGQPDNANQRPGPTPLATLLGAPLEQLQTNDDRMNQVSFANGLLYSAVNSKLSVNGADQTGAAWFAVKPTISNGAVHGRVIRQGYVAVGGNNVMYPAAAIAANGQGAMVFTLVGPDYFPSAAFVTLGGQGVSSSVRVAADGVGPDDGFTAYPQFGGTGAARWGDYSAAATDGESIWMATEYIPGGARTVLANWGTFVFGLTD